jgi:nicotinamide-nucleotide amidase
MSLAAIEAELIAVGDELISGATTDTNSAWLARELERLGIESRRTVVVGDDEDVAAEAIAAALARADVVILTGGLGPTEDDRTRHAVARATGRALEHSEQAWAGVRAWYAALGREIPASNRRQALLPQGAGILPNAAGTAPGFAVRAGAAELFALPGPPGEMRGMFRAEVRPRLAERAAAAGGRPALHRLQLLGLSESVFADLVGPWMDRGANPLLGCTVSEGVLTASLRGRGPDAVALVAGRAAELRERCGRWIFREIAGAAGEADAAVLDDGSIEAALGRVLIARGLTVTAAESCTAGLVAARLARVPGISAVLGESYVTYANAAKERLLGVTPAALAAHGAVSAEVASAMAAGAAARAGARVALAVSGVAGPGGGTPEKPVGTVAFASSVDGVVEAQVRRVPASTRETVRATAANLSLVLLWQRLCPWSPDGGAAD